MIQVTLHEAPPPASASSSFWPVVLAVILSSLLTFSVTGLLITSEILPLYRGDMVMGWVPSDKTPAPRTNRPAVIEEVEKKIAEEIPPRRAVDLPPGPGLPPGPNAGVP